MRFVHQEVHRRLTDRAAKSVHRAPCQTAVRVWIVLLALSRLTNEHIASKDKTVSDRDLVVLAKNRALTGGQEPVESASTASQANRATLIAPAVSSALHECTTPAATMGVFRVHRKVWLFLCPTT